MTTTTTAILLTLLSIGAMSSSQRKAPVDPTPKAVGQDISVGRVRAFVTQTMHTGANQKICWDTMTESRIVSSSEALNILAKGKITTRTSPAASCVIGALKKYSSLTAVRITQREKASRFEMLVFPDAIEAGRLHIFDLPSAGEVCVYCTEMIGRLAGKGCSCHSHTKKACGANPEVSCTSECTYCPNGLPPPEDLAKEICGTDQPWNSTQPFSRLAIGGSL